MAKTRKITATFEDGATIQSTTHRVYTHPVQNWYTTKWCGRPDLMLKAKAQLIREYPDHPVRVATVTHDPWELNS